MYIVRVVAALGRSMGFLRRTHCLHEMISVGVMISDGKTVRIRRGRPNRNKHGRPVYDRDVVIDFLWQRFVVTQRTRSFLSSGTSTKVKWHSRSGCGHQLSVAVHHIFV